MPHVTIYTVLKQWTPEPSVIIGLLALSAIYIWLIGRPGMAVTRGRKVGFALAIAVLALALLSPLDDLSDRYLFSAHMIQHLLLTLVAAPLMVRAMPPSLGKRLRINPLIAFFLFNFIFSLTHMPIWYEATLEHESLHVLEHLLYIGTAFINWLPVLNPARERRLSSVLSMLYLFCETLPMFAVGSIISLSGTELYTWYLRVPQLGPLTPVQDQSVAGLIMWIGGSFFYLGALTIVFFRWANREIGLDLLQQQDELDETRRAVQPEHQQTVVRSYGNGLSRS